MAGGRVTVRHPLASPESGAAARRTSPSAPGLRWPYPEAVSLQRLALSRSTVDRAAHRRSHPGLLEALLDRDSTAVFLIDGEQGPVVDTDRGPVLAFVDPQAAAAYVKSAWQDGDSSLVRLYLGDDATG